MNPYFEDIRIGDTLDLGSHTFTGEAIVAFAEKYDPQPFHLSEDGAARTHFGQLCASGWHTASVFMKLLIAKTEELRRSAAETGEVFAEFGPSPGLEDLKWIKPVFAGDMLTYGGVVTGKTESRSRPEWGLVHHDMFADNQDGERVFSFKASQFIQRRPVS